MKKNKIIIIFLLAIMLCIILSILIFKLVSFNVNKNVLWYQKYHIIAHSLGGINGYAYTNSLESFENSYKNGIRVFDADLNVTLDGEYVLRHEWVDDMGIEYSTGLKPTYNEFMSKKIHSHYTPLSLKDFLNIMNHYSDIYVAYDAKEDIVKMYSDLVSIAISENLQHVLDRIIVSFYKYEDYYKLKEIYPFKNYVIRHYENDPKNIDELINFCLENKIPVVNIKMIYVNENDEWKKLIDNGITVFAAIVNDSYTYNKLCSQGICRVVSDSLTESY